MIFAAIWRALAQLSDPRFLRVFALGLGLTAALLGALYAAVFFGVSWLLPDQLTLPLIGPVSWADEVLSGASLVLMMGLSVFLMMPVAAAFIGVFADDIAAAVEARHYPALPAPPALPLLAQLRESVAFLGVVVGVNLLALILYLPAGPLAPLLFWAVNGLLLGREFFQAAAMRHEGRAGAAALRKRHRLSVFAAGMVLAVPLSVPLVNLVMPVLGAAAFTHIYHRLRARN